MDRKELEQSSNSQNVKPYVVRITARGTSGISFKLELSDGSFFCVRADFLLDERIVKGFELDEDFYFRLREEEHFLFCREKGYELLNRRVHARQELYLKLLKREFEKKYIKRVLDEMELRGLLNDLEFGKKRAFSKIKRNPCGRNSLLADLLQKGLSRAVANEAIDAVLMDEDFEEAVKKAAEKLSRRSSMNKEKMQRSLIGKGFHWGNIKGEIERWFPRF